MSQRMHRVVDHACTCSTCWARFSSNSAPADKPALEYWLYQLKRGTTARKLLHFGNDFSALNSTVGSITSADEDVPSARTRNPARRLSPQMEIANRSTLPFPKLSFGLAAPSLQKNSSAMFGMLRNFACPSGRVRENSSFSESKCHQNDSAFSMLPRRFLSAH